MVAMAKKISVMNLCVARAIEQHGMIKGGRVGGRMAAFVIEWAQYQRDTGESPGNALAFSKWACIPKTTAYRRLEEFAALFPEHETPAPLARYVELPSLRSRSSSTVPA
jgi:hypothetical protein